MTQNMWQALPRRPTRVDCAEIYDQFLDSQSESDVRGNPLGITRVC
jgi:hypothetical protein